MAIGSLGNLATSFFAKDLVAVLRHRNVPVPQMCAGDKPAGSADAVTRIAAGPAEERLDAARRLVTLLPGINLVGDEEGVEEPGG